MSLELNHFHTKNFQFCQVIEEEEILEYTEWGINFQNVQSGLTQY